MIAVAAPLYALALALAEPTPARSAAWAAPPEVSEPNGPYGVLFVPRYGDAEEAHDHATRDVQALLDAVPHMDDQARADEAERLRARLDAVTTWRAQFAEALTRPAVGDARARLVDAHFRLAAEASTLHLQLDVLGATDTPEQLPTAAALAAPTPTVAADDVMGWGRPAFVAAGHTVHDAIAIGADVVVDGVVLADAVSIGGDVHIRTGGQVLGDAVAFGGLVHTAPGATVYQERLSLQDPVAALSLTAAEPPPAPSPLRSVRGVLVSFLTAAGASLLAVGLLPAHVARVGRTVTARPGTAAVTGLLGAVVVVVASLLAAITIIGLPVAALLLASLAVGGVLGFTGLCHAAGTAWLPAAPDTVTRWVPLAVGCLVLAVLGSLPWVLQLAAVVALVTGLGASLLALFGGR